LLVVFKTDFIFQFWCELDRNKFYFIYLFVVLGVLSQAFLLADGWQVISQECSMISS